MGRLSDKLIQSGTVGLDTSVFIYHFEAHPRYSALAQESLRGMEKGIWAGVTSTITLMEINVRPWQLENSEIARKYEALLVNFPNLTILDVDRDIARLAAQLRARFKLRPPDALQVGTALYGGAKAFLTNDKRLSTLRNLLDILILDDWVSLD